MEAPRKSGKAVIPTPAWFIALRVFQFIVALVIVALTGWWIHGLYYDELGFVIVCGLFTWIIAIYAVLSEKVSSCRPAYNTWAILALDALMIIFWLAAMGATANRRSTFTVPVNADCVSDGSTIDSGVCTVYSKRADVATKGALGVLSGIAGLCALDMLLFVPTFAYVCHYFRLSFAEPSSDPEKPGVALGTEMQAGLPLKHAAAQQSQSFSHEQQTPTQQQWAQQSAHSSPQQRVPSPQFQPGPVYNSYAPQNVGYAGPAGVYPSQQASPPLQELYSQHGTPAPGPLYQMS
ncbi:hypothetical protein F4779DRAFT_629828 [Xylariaceae sp. FL0662B]|nr:hypothetical protein F4779DRAFT_629828 [Xylariaceae sp. FL0662B]